MDSISFFWSFFKMLLALAIVIGLMLASAYYVKKYFLQSMPEMNGSAMINIVSTLYLSPKNNLMLIEVLGQVMLIGVTGQQMSVLSQIDDPEALEKIRTARIQNNQFSNVNPLARYKSLSRILDSMKKGR